jgi:hypothetical protein
MELKNPNEVSGFDGVFRFTNCSDEPFIALWNNKEYTFPPKSTCPMLIPNESPENVQNIRKMFAKKYAIREFQKSSEFTRLSGMGRGLPPIIGEEILTPWIQQCLEPLPVSEVKTKERPKDSSKNYKGSKAISKDENVNFAFKDEEPTAVGEMPE